MPGLAPQPSTPVNFDMPAGACDCHSHIFGPPDRFPMVAKRLYTPPPALPEELAAMHQFCHFERVVVVTPSIYGSDNHATYYGMAAFPNYAAIVPLAKAFIAANPDRIVWGTDWPHPSPSPLPGKKFSDVNEDYPIDDGDMLNQLPKWAPDAAIREKILVTNPARLYDFPPVTK